MRDELGPESQKAERGERLWPLSVLARQAARHGYAVVPVEPTEGMMDAGVSAEWGGTPHLGVQNSYRAMIEAGRIKP